MADISKYLSDILNAVFGEEVRGSIYNAIDIINKVGEKVFTIGTAVTSPNSSVSGYYENSLYLNKNTWDLWKCNGSSWVKQGNFQGAGISTIIKDSSSGLVDTYKVNLTDGSIAGTFRVTNGNKTRVGNEVVSENTSTTLSGVSYGENDIYINNITWDIWICNGTGWTNVGNIKGQTGPQGIQGYSITRVTQTAQSGLTDTYTIYNENNDTVGTFTVTNGEKGDTGNQGPKGDNGYSPTVTTNKSGKVATITITDITGPHTFTISDGNDGSGTGDMVKATYDTNDDGVVDLADNVANMDTYPTAGSGKPVTSGGLRQIIGDPSTLTTQANDLVGAINEAATSGLSGYNNTVSGTYANAAGSNNRATENNQFVIGTYNDNVYDENHTNAIFEVGNGTAALNRSNAFQVLKNGDAVVKGNLYIQGDVPVGKSVIHVGDYTIASSTWGTVSSSISGMFKTPTNIDTGLDIIYAYYGCDNQADFFSKYYLMVVPKVNNPILCSAVIQAFLTSNDTSVYVGGFGFGTSMTDVVAQIYAVPYTEATSS